ncbi:MAG: CGNR zinc finger domain-containing protein [Hyphomicrobiales bacterium]|nr:CGNR zinc finger domain-containing protein [Hyphomicrobiales bacterium]
MPVLWNRHRYSGGLLILDTTNTVVLRGDPARSFDRFADAAEIARFAHTASSHRSAELGGRSLSFERSDAAVDRVLELRESADRLFRATVGGAELHHPDLPALLRAIASCLEGAGEPGDALPQLRFETALAVSALALLSGPQWRRVRICRNCDWLFVDRSRNASRLWCDMSVCGNRQKARRHYERRKATVGDDANA